MNEGLQRPWGLHRPTPLPTFADGDREIRICEAIAQSARERKWAGVSS